MEKQVFEKDFLSYLKEDDSNNSLYKFRLGALTGLQIALDVTLKKGYALVLASYCVVVILAWM